ncbi:hypothetical protein BGX38DRAFT_353489 [Terfezia claveryi]|nr:hypothetical protein BGX38DRAFT_353489 [Terfezia claveryi]
MAANNVPPTTLITTKLLYNGSIRRFKIYLKDCGVNTLPGKLKELLAIPDDEDVIFERWSDSAASYVVLDSNKPAVYKQLYRAAKAKLKLRIKVTHPTPEAPVPEPFNSNNSTETLLPPYASTTHLSNPSTSLAESTTSTSVPLEKVSEAVVAYLEGEEGRSKLRTTIGEEVEKEIEKRHVLAQSVSNLSIAPPPAVEAITGKPKMREVVVNQVYAVYCNICNVNVDSVHYHCGVCDCGDFDLCERCVEEGKHCNNAEHWMIKRTIVNGEVISSRELIASTTAIVAKKSDILNQREEEKVVEEPQPVSGRTCNCCCEDFGDHQFVECTVCADYDLCLECHEKQSHGHDPSHSFVPATEETVLTPLAKTLLGPGKNFRHYAICDGCDKQIYGVRHKCFNCPDWDYCSQCYASASEKHPGHRFAPIYGPLAEPVSISNHLQHYGVYCDGPHCSTKGYCSWIVGDRYKCAVCHDFDLCASCEASPLNKHNPTHPLIKLKTPVRNVTVQTLDSEFSVPLGDRAPSVASSVASNASTSVQTVAEAQPQREVVPVVPAPSAEENFAEQVAEKIEKTEEKVSEVVEQDPIEVEEQIISERGDVLIIADYVKEVVADGALYKPGAEFTQTWTLINSGLVTWPAGCTIKFTGGDNMSASEITVTDAKVKTGTSVDFSVKLVAPAPTRRLSRRVISYWGLFTADGVRFGPQLWCDIEVKAEELKQLEVEEPKSVEQEVKKEVNDEVKEDEPKIEDDVADLVNSHTSQMIFPTLEKESPSNSSVNLAEAPVEVTHGEVPPSAVSTATIKEEELTADHSEDDVISEVYSVDELDDELENFISDDEDYEVWEASDDEEFGSSTNGSTGSNP